MKWICILVMTFLNLNAFSQRIATRFESSGGNETPNYFEIINWWQKLDQRSGKIKMLTMGMTDAGYPLHLVVVANNGNYNFENIRKNNKRIILINNGIHPGEPDGIDASMLLARDIVENKYTIADNIVLAIIPVYNIGGCLDRSEIRGAHGQDPIQVALPPGIRKLRISLSQGGPHGFRLWFGRAGPRRQDDQCQEKDSLHPCLDSPASPGVEPSRHVAPGFLQEFSAVCVPQPAPRRRLHGCRARAGCGRIERERRDRHRPALPPEVADGFVLQEVLRPRKLEAH